MIQGNLIGTNASGSAALPNRDGVDVYASNNTIGGTAPGAGNTIADNTGKGVVVAGGTGNAIEGNAIFGNTGLGIDLGNNGVTANTGSENAALPNSGMNFPVFTSAVVSGTTLTVGRLCRDGGGAVGVRGGPRRGLQVRQRSQRSRPGPDLSGHPHRRRQRQFQRLARGQRPERG